MGAPSLKNRRKHVRFKPNPLDYARISGPEELRGPEYYDNKSFKVENIALISDESYGGCGLIVITHQKYQVGDIYRIQVGALNPMLAEIKHITKLDDEVWKLGFQFLE